MFLILFFGRIFRFTENVIKVVLSPVPTLPPHLVSGSPDVNVLHDKNEPTSPHWWIELH